MLSIIELFEKFQLEQQQKEPTREGHLPDLFCTNKPGLVKACTAIPGISDHKAVVAADCLFQAKITKKIPRKIYQWSRADWDKMKSETSTFSDSYLESHTNRTIDENYSMINDHINHLMGTHVPSKMSHSSNHSPWLTNSVKHMPRKKQRLFNLARRTQKHHHWEKYKSYKRSTQKDVRAGHTLITYFS